jgi:hypothetical protein
VCRRGHDEHDILSPDAFDHVRGDAPDQRLIVLAVEMDEMVAGTLPCNAPVLW